MNFQNGVNRVDVYINENKIFINGVLHNISKVSINGQLYSRFKFEPGNVDVKITNGILSYDDGTGLKTFILNKPTVAIDNTTEIFTEYIVTTGVTVGINTNNTIIRFNDVNYDVKSTSKNGISTLYKTDLGTLSLSRDVTTRPDTWNNITIQKTT